MLLPKPELGVDDFVEELEEELFDEPEVLADAPPADEPAAEEPVGWLDDALDAALDELTELA